jgi:hypothetical protein
MRTTATMVILIGTIILLLWCAQTEDQKKSHALEQENAELRQKNKILQDIIDEKYLVVELKQIY